MVSARPPDEGSPPPSGPATTARGTNPLNLVCESGVRSVVESRLYATITKSGLIPAIFDVMKRVMDANSNSTTVTVTNNASAKGLVLSCGGFNVITETALAPLLAFSDEANDSFSAARVEGLAQYAVARASECVNITGALEPPTAGKTPLDDKCIAGMTARIRKDTHAASFFQDIRVLASVLVKKQTKDCVVFEFDSNTLTSKERDSNVTLIRIGLDLYEPRFAEIVITIFNYISYAAAVEHKSGDGEQVNDYQKIATDTLKTFAKPAQAGGGRKRTAPRARAGGRARVSTLVLSAPLCPAHWKQKIPA